MIKEKILIIGAGLSGLYTAYLLQENYDVVVLEARDRIGGRVYSVDGHDMGPSWVWGHQKHILQLIDFLDLELFEQYTKGSALYDAPEGVQKFSAPPSEPSYRIKGGIIVLIEALMKRLRASVHLNEKVLSLDEVSGQIEVKSENNIYKVDKVISTLPPRLAVESLSYTPTLSSLVSKQLQGIPTWMGYAAKCVVEYPHAFWKEEGQSGFTFSHLGPLSEIHDACTADKNALFGFVHSYAEYKNLKENIVAQLVRLYGNQAATPLNIVLVDWKKESYSSTSMDAQPLREHPSYGFNITHFGGKLLFSGTESTYSEGGYLEGALIGARETVEKIRSSV
ncbi:FAD-dependent oxidoreductase [Sulfurovum sp.]|uniref:flavin monoamine oxidase family protein n=1 Tax=Sulfurovum sp. TaxID=1969726 RepID=UPI002867E46B|nr:FAD-dependent oxidoreductase [Sulfurovum sp.]